MKAQHLTLLATLVISTTLHAESITLFRTGVDSTDAPLPGGASDIHWTVVSGPGIASPIPAIVINSQVIGSYAQSSLSRWVWVNADGVAEFFSPYTFRLTFDLTGFNPRTAVITGQWAADNEGFILLNGSATDIGTGVLSLSGTVETHFGIFHNFALTNGFQPGTNTLEFVVTDNGIIGGFNVEDLVGTAFPVPPAVLSIRCSQVEICWPSVNNNSYQLQYRSSLTADQWIDFGSPIAGDGSRKCVTDTVAEGEPQRFYRALTLP